MPDPERDPVEWRVGDRCELIVLAEGEIYECVVTDTSGPLVHVETDTGRMYGIVGWSPFLRRPE